MTFEQSVRMRNLLSGRKFQTPLAEPPVDVPLAKTKERRTKPTGPFDVPDQPWEVKGDDKSMTYNVQSGMPGSFTPSPPNTVVPSIRPSQGFKKIVKPYNRGSGTELEHAVPVWLGGTSELPNLVNMSKSGHEKKTAVEAVGWTLWNAQLQDPEKFGKMIKDEIGYEISIPELRAKSIVMSNDPNTFDVSGLFSKGYDSSMIYDLPGKTTEDQVELAIKTWKKWHRPLSERTTWEKVKEAAHAFWLIMPGRDLLGDMSKTDRDVLDDVKSTVSGWTEDKFGDNIVSSTAKGVVSGATLGSVAPELSEFEEEHPLQMLAGRTAGELVGSSAYFHFGGKLLGKAVSPLFKIADKAKKVSGLAATGEKLKWYVNALDDLSGNADKLVTLVMKDLNKAEKALSLARKAQHVVTTMGTFAFVGQAYAVDDRLPEIEARYNRLKLDTALGLVQVALPGGFLRGGYGTKPTGAETGLLGTPKGSSIIGRLNPWNSEAASGLAGMNLTGRANALGLSFMGNSVAEFMLSDANAMEAMQSALVMTAMHGLGTVSRTPDASLVVRSRAIELIRARTPRSYESLVTGKSSPDSFRVESTAELVSSYEAAGMTPEASAELLSGRVAAEWEVAYRLHPTDEAARNQYMSERYVTILREEISRSGMAAVTGKADADAAYSSVVDAVEAPQDTNRAIVELEAAKTMPTEEAKSLGLVSGDGKLNLSVRYFAERDTTGSLVIKAVRDDGTTFPVNRLTGRAAQDFNEATGSAKITEVLPIRFSDESGKTTISVAPTEESISKIIPLNDAYDVAVSSLKELRGQPDIPVTDFSRIDVLNDLSLSGLNKTTANELSNAISTLYRTSVGNDPAAFQKAIANVHAKAGVEVPWYYKTAKYVANRDANRVIGEVMAAVGKQGTKTSPIRAEYIRSVARMATSRPPADGGAKATGEVISSATKAVKAVTRGAKFDNAMDTDLSYGFQDRKSDITERSRAIVESLRDEGYSNVTADEARKIAEFPVGERREAYESLKYQKDLKRASAEMSSYDVTGAAAFAVVPRPSEGSYWIEMRAALDQLEVALASEINPIDRNAVMRATNQVDRLAEISKIVRKKAKDMEIDARERLTRLADDMDAEVEINREYERMRLDRLEKGEASSREAEYFLITGNVRAMADRWENLAFRDFNEMVAGAVKSRRITGREATALRGYQKAKVRETRDAVSRIGIDEMKVAISTDAGLGKKFKRHANAALGEKWRDDMLLDPDLSNTERILLLELRKKVLDDPMQRELDIENERARNAGCTYGPAAIIN